MSNPTDTREPVPITIAHGDGIGPEIMAASLKVMDAAGARLAPQEIQIGEQVYLGGVSSGIEAGAWDSLRSTKVFYKAPITTPLGGGYKSLNVTVRKSLGLFANVRPCAALSPFVQTNFPTMDVVIVRENEEDLYAGIEHRQTDEVFQCLKLVSRPGTERIIRYAFEFARAHGRKKVSCFSKDNIMKLTDGLYHQAFDRIAKEYPEIENDHWIIDIAAAKLAAEPERFDVIVTSNLYGDIISDIAAEISGSVGLGASANIGEHCAMFEAIHGSAPDIAGKAIANPSGLLLAGVQMLAHIGQADVAGRVHNAWLRTIEDGIHTGDIYNPNNSKEKVGTRDFADAVIDRIGKSPESLPARTYRADAKPLEVPPAPRQAPTKDRKMIGVDIFVNEDDRNSNTLAERLKSVTDKMELKSELNMITNRGVKVWPDGLPETFCTDHWRCRFYFGAGEATPADVATLLTAMAAGGIDFIKTEQLYEFDGAAAYSLGQGQ